MALYASRPYKMLCFYQNLIVPTWGYHTGLDEWHAILVMMETGWGRLTWRTHCSKFSSNILSSKRGVIVALGWTACLYLCPTLLYRWDLSRIHYPLWFCCLPGSPVHEEGRPVTFLPWFSPATLPALPLPQVWPLTLQVPHEFPWRERSDTASWNQTEAFMKTTERWTPRI